MDYRDALSLSLQEAHFLLYTRNRIDYERKKDKYEIMRLHAFLTLSPYLDRKRVRTADKLYPFPWDKNYITAVNIIPYTEEEFEPLDRMLEARRKRLSQKV